MAHDSEKIFEVVRKNIVAVLGIDADLVRREIAMAALGANSLDRADIVIMTMEDLALRIPAAQLQHAKNIGELVDLLYAKQQ